MTRGRRGEKDEIRSTREDGRSRKRRRRRMSQGAKDGVEEDITGF